MPLAHVDRPGYENAQGVHFPMRRGDTIVRVLVARRVLETIERAPVQGDSYIARFEVFRREFESIASDKFDHGPARAKIEITADDMMKFLVERLNAV